jgi:hypothetical protein
LLPVVNTACHGPGMQKMQLFRPSMHAAANQQASYERSLL